MLRGIHKVLDRLLLLLLLWRGRLLLLGGLLLPLWGSLSSASCSNDKTAVHDMGTGDNRLARRGLSSAAMSSAKQPSDTHR